MSKAQPPLPENVREVLQDWLLREMSDISEDAWCAGWLCGLEHILWNALEQLPEDPAQTVPLGIEQVPVRRLQRLKSIADLLGQWGVWGENRSCCELISIEEWLPEHRAWMQNLQQQMGRE